ncbi:MAG: MFS transporter [Thermoproteota archaeon]
MRREVIILSLIAYFLFLGAGSSQTFVIPHLNTMFPGIQSSLVLATVYLSIILGVLLNIPLKQKYLKNKLILGVTGYVTFPFSIFLTREYVLLIASSIYFGITVAFFWIQIFYIVLNVSDEKEFGTNSGIVFLGSGLGTFFGTILLGLVQKTYGYDFVFLTAALLSMLGFLPTYLLAPSGGKSPERVRLKDLLVISGSKIVTFLYFFGYFGYGTALNSVSCAVSSILGPPMIGPVLSGFFLVSALLSVYSGKLSDTLGRRKTFIIAFSLGAFGLFLNSVLPNLVTLMVLCILLGFQTSAVPVNALGWIGERTRKSGRLSSICSSLVWDSAAVTTSILSSSVIYEFLGSYQSVFFSFGVFSLFCSILSYFLK